MRLGSLGRSIKKHLAVTFGFLGALSTPLTNGSVLAHGTAPHGSGASWYHWQIDPLVTILLVVSSVPFTYGIWRLRRSLGRFPPGLGMVQVFCFATGTALLAATLLSQLESLSRPLLSVHMIQHILLIAVAPPLLVLGKPEVAWLWALPAAWRRGMVHSRGVRSILSLLSPCARPIPAALIHMTALWIWHSPKLFDAAVASDRLHWLEHVLFFGTALLFWHAIIKARSGRAAAAAALIACLITLLQSGLLSALLSFAREPLYRTPASATWGITALADQQLAGALMSLPMCAIYLASGFIMALRLLTPPSRERRRLITVAPTELLKQNP